MHFRGGGSATKQTTIRTNDTTTPNAAGSAWENVVTTLISVSNYKWLLLVI